MKFSAGLTLLLAGALIAGCASHQKKVVVVAPVAPKAIITPDNSMTATVAMYNALGRYVVLNFPAENMPTNDQVFFIYHGGLKSGEVKITGPSRNNSTVADLVNGEAQAGDDVRDQ